MLRRLFAIFRPPVFEDEERTRIASLLTPVLWLMLGIAALIGISALLVPRIPDSLLIAAVILTVGSLGCLQFVERGHVKIAAGGSIVFIWLIVTMNSTIFGELTSFNILYYLILIVFAGLLLGNRATVYTALINFLTIGTIFALEPIGVLSVTRLSTTAFGIWLSVGMQITLITLLMLLANRANKKSLDEASRGPTERLDKNGERASSERPYRLMVENISEPIFLLDRDMGFKYISPAGERDMGIISKEHLGKSLIEFVHPEDQEQVAAMFYELVGHPGVVARTECRILGKSFQWLWYGVVAVNKLSDPDLMAIVANFNEISSRVEAEDRSRRQGLRNRKLAELSKLLAESSQDYEAVLWTISRQVAEILNCGCSVVLISGDNQWLDYVASYNTDKEVEEVWQRIRESERQKIDEGIMGQVVGEGKPVLIPEVDPDAFLAATKPEFREYLKDVVYQTILVVPMRARGQVLGALGLSRQAPGPAFTVLDQDFAQDLGDRCALAIINARLFSDLQGELGERKQAQAALKRSQETLAEAQRIGNMGSYVFDIQTKKMSWSDQLYRISGLEPGDTPVDEDFASSFVHPQDWDAVRQNTKSALENGFSAVEHRIITKSGDLRYMYTSTHAFYNENGVAVGLMGTVQDISNRKKVEIDLHQRDAILEAVALAAQNFMHSADWDKNVWALLKILGEKNNASRAYIYRNEFERRESPVTALHYQWINPERVSDLQVTIPQVMYLNEEALDGWSRTMQAGKPYYGNIHRMTEREKRLLLIGDAKTFIHVPVFSGDDWQGFIGFDDPTSERSWSTAEVDALTVAAGLIGAAIQSQRAELARRESERLVRILGDNLPGGAIYQLITYPNGDRKYTYISEGVESLLGISAVQVLEDAENLYKRVHPYDRDMYLKLEDDCIRNMKVFDANVRVDGHGMNVRWCHFRAAPRQGEGNEITWNGVIQDITPQKEAEEAIHALNVELEARVQERTTELEETNQELTAFSYSVSHDLRAPLRGIDGYSSLLLQDYSEQLSPEARDYLNNIRLAAQRMGDLIHSLLQFSRLSRIELKKSQVDLNALSIQVLEALQASEPGRKVEWVVQPELSVKADPELLQVIMENLLGNAWKFSSKIEQSRIEVGVEEQDGRQVYFVRDNGAGFDMDYVDRIFEPFERLHHVDEYPGAGIGLATVRRILERHGGKIWAESAEGAGATFWFWL